MQILLCRFVLLLALLASNEVVTCVAAEWPPTDPKEYSTETNFTLSWAKRLRGFKTLTDLQRAAKSKGTISEQSLESAEPFVRYHWRSAPLQDDEIGYMLATVLKNGTITVEILTTDKHQVTISNSGAFTIERAR